MKFFYLLFGLIVLIRNLILFIKKNDIIIILLFIKVRCSKIVLSMSKITLITFVAITFLLKMTKSCLIFSNIIIFICFFKFFSSVLNTSNTLLNISIFEYKVVCFITNKLNYLSNNILLILIFIKMKNNK